MDFDLATIKFLIYLGFLSVASIQDVRSRYISDIIWIIAGIVLAPILFFEVIIGRFDIFATILSVIFAVAIAYPLNRIGFLGGADGFALVLLALYMPSFESKELLGLPVISVIANASILSLTEVCVNFSRNVSMLVHSKDIFLGFEGEPTHRKILAMFMGHRSAEVRGLLLPMERMENGRRCFNFSVGRASSDFAKGNDIWVTPALPFIVYITAGYILLFLIGDLLQIVALPVF
ncbi:MAG: A24 family peptidase C-terminal domain-containing protein [Nitrososphaerales archaeon]